ncbi:hypothetical protein ZWY2020_031142 [Hordeum vulgare]|nr:hypothetical protein ZWY2020_031142 [Hordeum vulgare]
MALQRSFVDDRRGAVKVAMKRPRSCSEASPEFSVAVDRSDIKNCIERERYAQNREEILKRQRQAHDQKKHNVVVLDGTVTQLANITYAGGTVPNSIELLDENENIYGGDESDWLHRNDAYQIQRKSGQVRVTQMEVVENPQLNLRIQEDSFKKRECDGDRNQIETTDVNHDEEARIFAEREVAFESYRVDQQDGHATPRFNTRGLRFVAERGKWIYLLQMFLKS